MLYNNGVNVLRGEYFHVPPQEAEDLIALNFARLAEDDPIIAVLETKHEAATEPTITHQRRGRYSRRDLRSEN